MLLYIVPFYLGVNAVSEVRMVVLYCFYLVFVGFFYEKKFYTINVTNMNNTNNHHSPPAI